MTGQLEEEKTHIYVRLRIRLLYQVVEYLMAGGNHFTTWFGLRLGAVFIEH
jgi:hypothetical protein